MYNIKIDITKKLIIIEVSGCMQMEETKSYVNELIEVYRKLEPKVFNLLVLAQRMDPLPQECVVIFKKATELALTYMNKVAVVHSRFVTQMQMRRLEEEVKSEAYYDNSIIRFNNKTDAMNYLNK